MSAIDVLFWSKVDKSGGPEACWPWTAGKIPAGYGAFHVRRKVVGAHRFALETVHGPLGDLLACHRCDNPGCCNPAHLFAGTYSDNVRDMDAKGRRGQMAPEKRARGDRHGTKTKPESLKRGADHWTHRMPERVARGLGVNSPGAMAVRVGVTKACVMNWIREGKVSATRDALGQWFVAVDAAAPPVTIGRPRRGSRHTPDELRNGEVLDAEFEEAS